MVRLCKAIIEQGPRKGQKCLCKINNINKKYCGRHKKYEKKSNENIIKKFKDLKIDKKYKECKEECPICLETISYEKPITVPCCKKVLHFKCLKKWLDKKNTCPLCRSSFVREGNTKYYWSIPGWLSNALVNDTLHVDEVCQYVKENPDKKLYLG